MTEVIKPLTSRKYEEMTEADQTPYLEKI